MKCGRLGCEQRATHRIKPQYGRPVVRCQDHVKETAEVIGKFENRQQTGARVEAL